MMESGVRKERRSLIAFVQILILSILTIILLSCEINAALGAARGSGMRGDGRRTAAGGGKAAVDRFGYNAGHVAALWDPFLRVAFGDALPHL